MVIGRALALAIAVLGLASGARADGDGKAEFERANKFFEAGEYEAAMPLYEVAYRASGRRPSTIRALAQCERALRRYEMALAHFHEYLATKPSDAAQIVETVKLVEELLAEQRRAKAEASAAPPPAPPATEAKPPAPPVTEAKAPPPATAPPAELSPKAPPPVDLAAPPPPATDDGIHPAWWIAISVLAAAGASVAVGVALSGPPEPDGGTTGVVLFR